MRSTSRLSRLLSSSQSRACREFDRRRKAFLQKLRAATAKAGALLIFDEIQTGIGRLGYPFAAAKHEVAPDLLTSAKGIASGVPMGALLMSDAVARQLKFGDLGSTFGGSPLACAAMLATLAVISEERLMERALAAEETIRKVLRDTCVDEIRGAGLLLGLCVPSRAAELKRRRSTTHRRSSATSSSASIRGDRRHADRRVVDPRAAHAQPRRGAADAKTGAGERSSSATGWRRTSRTS